MRKELDYFKIDFMRWLWGVYHKWILHKGRFGIKEYIFCHHQNPYYILTPRLFREQMENAWDASL